MCRTEAEGGRRCARANPSRGYRTSLTERLARNRRLLAQDDLSDARRHTLGVLVARDEFALSVLHGLIEEHGEVVTGSKDDTAPLVGHLRTVMPGDTMMTPVAPLPTVTSSARNRAELRKVARTAGKITAEADGAVYVRAADGTHLRLTNEKTQPVYTADGVRVNLLGMVVDPDHAVDSHPDTASLYLTAINLDRLRGNPDASLRGVAQTAQRVRGIGKDTMSVLRSNEAVAGQVSDKQRRRSWLDIANGSRPDRAFANLRLARLEGAYEGLSERNDVAFRDGARSLATTMRAANVQPTMRAEMLAGYFASTEPTFARSESTVRSLIKDKTGQERALFFSNTRDGSFVTEPDQVREMAEYASSLGTTIRERCYVASAFGDERSASMLAAAERLGLADGVSARSASPVRALPVAV